MSKKIFVLDDDISILEIVNEILKAEGFEVYTFENAASLLKVLENVIPNLIILDIMMPDINGIDFCAQLRKLENSKRTPIVILSARVDDLSKRQAFIAGANGFLTKPFTARDLLSSVRTYLDLTTIF